MNPVDIVINQIIKNQNGAGEGLQLEAYQDPAGKWTIGYGHTGPGIDKGVTWTAEHAEFALRQDVGDAYLAAIRASSRLTDESPSRKAAITDFIYNVGIGCN